MTITVQGGRTDRRGLNLRPRDRGVMRGLHAEAPAWAGRLVPLNKMPDKWHDRGDVMWTEGSSHPLGAIPGMHQEAAFRHAIEFCCMHVSMHTLTSVVRRKEAKEERPVSQAL